MLRRNGPVAGAKRLLHARQLAGLRAPRRRTKHRGRCEKAWPYRNRCRDHARIVDLLFDRSLDGKHFNALSRLNEFTRERVVLRAMRSLRASLVTPLLKWPA